MTTDNGPPMDVKRLRVGRLVRCPRCRTSFQSLRLAHYACPECGNAWVVEHPRTASEKVMDALGGAMGHVAIGIMWLMLAVLVAGVLGGAYLFMERLSHSWGLSGIVVGLAFLAAASVYAIRIRAAGGSDLYSGHPAERYKVFRWMRRTRARQ